MTRTEAGDESLATTDEVAAWLHIEPKTLANWRSQHIGPDYIKIGNNRVRYEWPALRKWVTDHTVQAYDGAG